jgi:hypothetical protein
MVPSKDQIGKNHSVPFKLEKLNGRCNFIRKIKIQGETLVE